MTSEEDRLLREAGRLARELRGRQSAAIAHADVKLGESNVEVLLAIALRGRLTRTEAEVRAMIERLDRSYAATSPAFKSTHASIRRVRAALEWVLGGEDGGLEVFLRGLE